MNTQWVRSLLSILTIALLAGCASAGKDLVRDGTIEVEKVSSRQATITLVQVIQEGEEVLIRGQVQRRPIGRGPIPGHIDVELIEPGGGVLEKIHVGYHRRSAKSRYAEFHGTLKTTPPAGSTLKVIHDVRSHAAPMDDVTETEPHDGE
ncbi:MAG: hypothetical protein AB1810_09150 [Pseudomonadota bacterium]